MGVPWKNLDKYLKLSYPFLKADRIKTPRFLSSVKRILTSRPLAANKCIRRCDTGSTDGAGYLPGPISWYYYTSYQKDRFDRYLEWFDRYLKESEHRK